MPRKILLVDDEPYNLEIMEGYLRLGANAKHEIVKAKDGKTAMEILRKNPKEIDVILLDRMMPGFSGVDFMKKHNMDDIVKNIPVIMQTASNEQENVLEGFKMGVYHYLIKPYSPNIFNSVVKAAISFYAKYSRLLAQAHHSKTLFNYVNRAEFNVKTLHDVDALSVGLAMLFPNPDRVIFGISEILINAIEHGNLSITYDEKTQLNLESRWHEEVKRRLALPENAHKSVAISYFKRNGEIILNIKDEGNGFEFEKYLQHDPSRSMDNHGRGIAFAKGLSFDRLEYIGSGNEVNCVVKLNLNS